MVQNYNEKYEDNELFNQCGELLKALGPYELTSDDAEYRVTYYKLYFAGCMIFEYKIQNTLPDTVFYFCLF